MDKVILLTQDNCPNCTSLKMFLEFGLKNKYKDEIEVVHRQSDEQLFTNYVKSYEISSTPALIYKGEVLRDCAPTKAIEFLKHTEQ